MGVIVNRRVVFCVFKIHMLLHCPCMHFKVVNKFINLLWRSTWFFPRFFCLIGASVHLKKYIGRDHRTFVSFQLKSMAILWTYNWEIIPNIENSFGLSITPKIFFSTPLDFLPNLGIPPIFYRLVPIVFVLHIVHIDISFVVILFNVNSFHVDIVLLWELFS